MHTTQIERGAEVLARRRAASGIAAMVGCDVRTATRALELGVDAIRPLRLREELRASIAKISKARARRGAGVPANAAVP